jgi:hypothetical protein
MNCKYVLVEGEDDFRCNSFEDVVRALIDEKYYDMSDEEKQEALRRKAAANEINGNIFEGEKDLSSFDLEDETTFILSLLKQGAVYLLENTSSRELTKNIDIPDTNKNYIVVNNFAEELLDNYKKDKNVAKKEAHHEEQEL